MKHILAIDPGTEKSGVVMLTDGVPTVSAILLNGSVITRMQELPTDYHLAIEVMEGRCKKIGIVGLRACEWVGRFIQAWLWRGAGELGPQPITRLEPRQIHLQLCGNVVADITDVRAALIDTYGGGIKAIGGVRCRKCKGRGTFGTQRKVCPCMKYNDPTGCDHCNGRGYKGREPATCPECDGEKWETPPGPLYGIPAGKDHMWSALAVGRACHELAQQARAT